MRGSCVRRPLGWPILSLLTLLLPLSWGCQLPGGSAGAGSGSSSSSAGEAERTRRMEEKAAEIDRKAEEIRNMDGSDQEKMDAVNRLEQERREPNEMQESGADRP
jgi:hypothetical protein